MKTRTNDFKNGINQLGRILDNKINVYENYILKTEDDKKILTENDILLIANTQSKDLASTLNNEHLFNIQVIQKGNILSTMMKEIDFESDVSINVGTTINYQFGLYVDDDFEYLDYGDYIIYKKEYDENTKHWNYVCYDAMLKTMVMLDDTSIIENNMIANAIVNISNRFNLVVDMSDELLDEYPNLEKTIATGTFIDMEMTYRDVLEQICQAVGVSMYVDSGELKFKGLQTEVVDTIDKTYLKDMNVTFKEKYGVINSLVLSRSEDNDNIYFRDDESIEQNGLHEFKIKDNLILNGEDREDYIENIFNQINGLEFYINDYQSVGICYLDWLDFYNVNIDGNIYKCLMLNDEIKVNSGLSESIYTEAPEETVTDYTTASKTDKEVSFIVDKQNAKINMKVSKGDVINEINLDESGASIRADKINLTGYVTASDLAGTGTTVINGANITTGSINCDLLNGGTINGQTINGGSINGTSITSSNDLYVGQNQTQSDLTGKGIYFKENTYIKRQVSASIDVLSLNSPGVISLKNNGNSILGIGSTINAYSNFLISPDGSNPVAYFYSDHIQFAFQPIISSDKRLKDNIEDINNVSWIDDLKVKEYEYKTCKNVKRIGLIAQDYIDKDYSKYFLDKNEDGYYGIRYNDITNALIQYCQEMKKEINSLKEEIKQLKESDK